MNKEIKIQVLGSGCPTCKKLYELTKEAVVEINLGVDVEYITDIQKIVEMGVMQSPVLAINGKPVITGSLPNIKKIKEIITANIVEDGNACCSDKSACDIKCKSDDENTGRSCGCKC